MNKSRYFKLGLFVLIGAGLFAGAILGLGAGRVFEKKIRAETIVDESINGLEEGSAVKYRGVTIGRVNSIAFAAKKDGGSDPQEDQDRIARYIVIDMALESTSFKGMSQREISDTLKRMIKNGLRARIAQMGIGGGVYVALDFLDPRLYPLPEVSRTSTAIYIPSAPSTMRQVVGTVERLAEDLRQANIPLVIQHIDGLVANATRAMGTVEQVVEANRANVNTVVSDLPAITSRLRVSSARIDDILQDKRLTQTIANISGGSASANQTIADLRALVQDLRSMVVTQQGDIQAIVADLRRMANNLAALSDDARDNPSRLLLGEPPPRKQPGE